MTLFHQSRRLRSSLKLQLVDFQWTALINFPRFCASSIPFTPLPYRQPWPTFSIPRWTEAVRSGFFEYPPFCTNTHCLHHQPPSLLYQPSTCPPIRPSIFLSCILFLSLLQCLSIPLSRNARRLKYSTEY